jgi:hypothetical protein
MLAASRTAGARPRVQGAFLVLITARRYIVEAIREDGVVGPMMTDVATRVLTTVNAPYGMDLSAHQLAAMIADPRSAVDFSAPVFAFFSEVPAALQKQCLMNKGIDQARACEVAHRFSALSGYALPLAA